MGFELFHQKIESGAGLSLQSEMKKAARNKPVAGSQSWSDAGLQF